MRITRDHLLKIARDTAAQRVRVSRRLVSIYLTGSVLSEEPLLGGTTDIDLVCIHDSEPLQAREVVRLNDEISLDISHYAQDLFRQPRHLRLDPWLGPILYNKPLLLHDTAHWFEFTQASTGAQFLQADNVLARARSLSNAARARWMQMAFNPPETHPRRVYGFLKSLEEAGNAVAVLSGLPLTERRFLLQFRQRATAIQRPELAPAFENLLAGGAEVSDEDWQALTAAWEAAYQAAGQAEDCPPRLHPARRWYYQRAFNTLWAETPNAAFWILLRTWTQAVYHLPGGHPDYAPWLEACRLCGLGKDGFAARMEGLDKFLDATEEALDTWGARNGVSTTPEI